MAARLAEDGTEGTFFVELAPVSEPGQVPATVATSVGVLEQPGRPLLEVLAEALRKQDLLIVIDNCEHVIGAAAELAEVLNRSCPRVRLLATSREPLGIGGEHVYRLAPLSLPAEDATSLPELQRSEAVKLFVERASSHDSTFSLEAPVAGLVGSICRTLDGIPLALELAAARVPGMSLADLDKRLGRRFSLLTGGSRTALPRQRTLQATFDWSFELLSGAEQQVLMRLSVFSGSFELDAAEAVCTSEAVSANDVADLLGSLVGKSLVVAQRSSGSLRYSLLETVRQYGAERLLAAGGEAALGKARSAHAEYYLQLAERADLVILGADQARWLNKLGFDWDNIRSAWATSFPSLAAPRKSYGCSLRASSSGAKRTASSRQPAVPWPSPTRYRKRCGRKRFAALATGCLAPWVGMVGLRPRASDDERGPRDVPSAPRQEPNSRSTGDPLLGGGVRGEIPLMPHVTLRRRSKLGAAWVTTASSVMLLGLWAWQLFPDEPRESGSLPRP